MPASKTFATHAKPLSPYLGDGGRFGPAGGLTGLVQNFYRACLKLGLFKLKADIMIN